MLFKDEVVVIRYMKGHVESVDIFLEKNDIWKKSC
jgi:hypothetical protein